ncbi:MAG: bifunctional shikimate kinase/3-dehydroquinate synthase [Candidatus Sericytochromatia bacterium]|nr:bifunctional shikimate kinase/3-dehydroquinate synthase [Candidatus Sericytochromatia bacterium]
MGGPLVVDSCGHACTCSGASPREATGHLFLAGHPGAGKSTLGPLLAEGLARPFVDLDGLVAQREGLPASALIRRDGERGFRVAEARALEGLSTREPLLVALGGGTLEHVPSRAWVARSGALLWLDVPTRILKERVRHGDRPLLAAAGGIESLVAARRETVARQLRRLTPEVGAPEAQARAILSRLGPGCKALEFPSSETPHALFVGFGALERALQASGPRVALVTSAPLWRRFGPAVRGLLEDCGRQVEVFQLPDGERAKTWSVLRRLVDALLGAGFGRHDTLVALGGGTVGDVAGFAAALVGRGMPWIQIPTTLLAMVDAAIGGKVAINHARGRNLVGAFHQPLAVALEPWLLASLPERHWRSGLGEIVKTLWLAGGGWMSRLREAEGDPRRWSSQWLQEVLWACAAYKASVVARDPEERHDLRIGLNLGHTVAHALEAAYGYKELTHGEAVAIGLRAACRLSEAMEAGHPGLEDRLVAVLGHLGLPTLHKAEPADVLEAMASDKKAVSGKMRWVLPVREGMFRVSAEVPQDLVARVVADLAAAPSRR